MTEPLELRRVVHQLVLQTPCPTCGRMWNTEGESGVVADVPGPADSCCVAFLLTETRTR